ncbi:hypothetical protein G7059_03825 [Erysipelothrix sp. HDW6A]|uniref:hypothetical protein n=1 Tax=Erysipelothrix sp. HDW6A TaxID=2714928 RepID=UPI00140D0BB8|nr:hypothetical protein [Erysipelothrix sp. HDW6A]QIK57036.1 hypothetical protein G7059_03825 [Erysipelothrix sp. HDW6A]
MKKNGFLLVICLLFLVGCSNSPKEEENDLVMPLEITYNNEVLRFGSGVGIDDFKSYPVLEITPPMVAKKDADTITFVYTFDINGEPLMSGLNTKYLGGRDISAESKNVSKDGVFHYYSFDIEDLEPGMLMYNGVDMMYINTDIITEWSGKETVINGKDAWFTFTFKDGAIRFMVDKDSNEISGFLFRTPSE